MQVLTGQWRHVIGPGGGPGQWQWVVGVGGGAAVVIDGTARFTRTLFEDNSCLAPAGSTIGGGALTLLGGKVFPSTLPYPSPL